LVGLVGYSINALGLKYFNQLPVTTNLAASFHFWSDHWPLIITTQPSAWAAAMAAELAIISNFTLNNFWTFQGKSITNPFRFLWKFLHFNITSIGAVIIQFLVVGYAVIFFGNKELVRQLALVVAVGVFIVPYNYTMYNLFIWKTWKVPGLGWLQNRKA
jgi:putative flippase GtrA